MSNRNAYIEKMKLQLDELNLKLDEMEARSNQATQDAGVRYRENMEQFRAQSALARAKFEELKVAGEESWDSGVAQLEKLRGALAHSFRDFKAQL
jgi:hypothetical protein